MKTRGNFLLILALAIILFSSLSSAQSGEYTHVVSNSDNWRDVYSTVHFAGLSGVGSDFLVSTKHGPLLLNGISKENNVLVVTSEERPYVINYPSLIISQGFAGADEIEVQNANLELIEELPEINNFIIVGNTYGYNAIAVTPYAVATKSWVFLADSNNIEEIVSILNNRDVESVITYGFLDSEVEEALQEFDPEAINTGDRFQDNVEIVEKYLELRPTDQVVLTNGEFIEKEVMNGVHPVLFTGKENVPPQIAEFLKNSDIEVGVLIGSDLVGVATNIRRSTGISVIVKFARGARAPTGAVAAVEGLDLFYLAAPILELTIHSAKYNIATSQLEITYKSNSNVPVYFRGTITPIDETGTLPIVGDIDPIFIAPNDFKTVSYPDIEFTGDSLSIEVFTLYGETPTSLEKILQVTLDVEQVNVIDGCEIELKKATYSIPKESFKIKIKNLANIDCWVDVELVDVTINGKKITIGSEGAILISEGKTKSIIIEQVMSDEDLEENQLIDIVAYYGEREDSLVKILKAKLELDIERITMLMIIIILLVILAIFLIIFIIIKRRREKEDF